MSYATLILGKSGSGKSASLRNLDPEQVALIQAVPKALPFPGAKAWLPWDRATKTGTVFVSDSADRIIAIAQGVPRPIIVIDDFQYVMANEFMRRASENGYMKFTEIGRRAWDILMAVNALDGNKRVYVLSHSDTDELGNVKAKTIGKMLDEKITLEGLFTIVLRSIVRPEAEALEEQFVFSTRTNGFDPVKAPMGMFEAAFIPNDIAALDARICEYYATQQLVTALNPANPVPANPVPANPVGAGGSVP